MGEFKITVVAGGLLNIFILFIIPHTMSSGKLSTFSFQLYWTWKEKRKRDRKYILLSTFPNEHG